ELTVDLTGETTQFPPGFILPDMKLHDYRWTGFWRSIEKETGNRYTAKCIYCNLELPGRPEKLHTHVLTCDSWPITEKNSYLKEVTNSISNSRKKIKKNLISDQESLTDTDGSSSSAVKRQESLVNWYIKPISQDKQAKINKKLLDAIIYSNLSFRVIENPYFLEFLNELEPNYNPPSANMLRGKVLNNSFSTYLNKKLEVMESQANITIALDVWQDISRNSIYGFMALKEDKEHVLDIVDLSANRHTATFLKDQLEKILNSSSISLNSAIIACVTDNSAVMTRMKNILKEDYPNIIPIQWQKKEGLRHSLTTFCETRWYSLAKVCLGVKAFENGFNKYIDLSKTSNYLAIRMEIQNIITNRHHFANNDTLLKVLIPIIDAIGRLESRDATLADIFKELLSIHCIISTENVSVEGFKNHALAALDKRTREFSDGIYFVSFFLSPSYKQIAMSGQMSGDLIVRASLELAKAWGFDKKETTLLFKELISYKNGDVPFENQYPENINPRIFWTKFTGGSPLIRRFAIKVFAIVPHSASVERLFSSLGLVKTKLRNRMSPALIGMLGMLRHDLQQRLPKMPKKSPKANDQNIFEDSINSENANIDLFEEEFNEEFSQINIEATNLEIENELAIEQFFNIGMLERNQENIIEDYSVVNSQ
ncbi:12305_t:CDS:2, partial [Cetraspora pellucida]